MGESKNKTRFLNSGTGVSQRSENSCFRVGFNPKLKIGFRGTATADGRFAVIRELAERRPGELFRGTGYIVTSLKWSNKQAVKFHNKRGTCKQWIKEGEHALNRTRPSCRGFAGKEVRLKPSIMAYNSGSIFRTPSFSRNSQ